MRADSRIRPVRPIATSNDRSTNCFWIARAGSAPRRRGPIHRILGTLAILLIYTSISASLAWADDRGTPPQDAALAADITNCDRQADKQSAEASKLTPIAPTSILNPILLLNDLNRRQQQEANQPRLLDKIELERQQCRRNAMAAAAGRAQEQMDQKSDFARGYKPITFEAFALDGKMLAAVQAKITIKGAYFSGGNLEWLFANQLEAFQANRDGLNVSRIPLLTEDATREFRKALLQCKSTPGSDQMGCPTVIVGHVSICSISGALGGSRNLPCIIVENGR
jgi:hypothetical protein